MVSYKIIAQECKQTLCSDGLFRKEEGELYVCGECESEETKDIIIILENLNKVSLRNYWDDIIGVQKYKKPIVNRQLELF